MAMLGGWLSAASREKRGVLRALSELSEHKTPLRVEVEGKGLSYFTVLSLRRNALLLARPRTLPAALAKEDWVRLTLPNRGRRQVRAPVVTPHIKVPFSVKHATICGVPTAWSGRCQRKADRFSTTRFRNLYLQLAEPERSFRVVDLSTAGLRVLIGPEVGALLFEEGSELGPARLRVGERVRIELDSLVPRGSSGKTVGLAMRVARDGASERHLLHLLNRLQDEELRRVEIDTA